MGRNGRRGSQLCTLPTDGSQLIASEVVLRSQWEARRERQFTGEQRLMFAILEDCLREFANQRRTSRPCVKGHDGIDAAAWFRAHDPEWPFSFVRVCEALNLDPEAIRRKLFASSISITVTSHRVGAGGVPYVIR